MNDALLDRIRPVTRRLRSVRFWRALSVIALLGAGVAWLLKTQVDAGQLEGDLVAKILLGVAVGILLLTAFACHYSFRNPRKVAKQIEDHFPSLDQRLLTALSQRDDELSYLQQRVVKEARDHSRTHRWAETVPTGKVFWSRLSGLGAAGLFAATLVALTFSNPSIEESNASNIPSKAKGVQVEPGSVEVERGTSLVVTAEFDGWVPDEADLVCEADDGSERRLTMTQNLDDPIVGGFVSSVDQPFTYRVSTPNWESEPFRVEVFEYPSLVRSDAALVFPSYTGLDDKLIEDTVRVSAVEGTTLEWICFLNKPVASAELVAKDGSRLAMTESDSHPGAYVAKIELSETARLKLELVDDVGRKNKYPPELVARVFPNQPPSLKLTMGGDIAVSPLEEIELGAEVRDDFGVAKYGLSYTFATDAPKDVVLGESLPRGAKQEVGHLLAFEDLGAEPDQLLSYHFWAEDVGPDGQPRRVESDMFFAEVRPFDEIFREGEQPPGGQQQQQQQQQQSQNGQQAEKLGELQKEIINATWRVIREERKPARTDLFDENVDLIREGQQDALAQLEELAGELTDAASIQIVDLIRSSMKAVVSQLQEAKDSSLVTPLNGALTGEQAAYGGLLRLRAREYEVTRQQRQQSQSQSQSQSQRQRQRQMNELELDQDENRYETERQAQEQSEQEQQEREVRQVLSRLRELARRQEDLNKELAQLQSALEEAKTEEEKEEIERQLKRLRDQQQDLLRETDELSERMQEPENQEEMAEASERLEETRENVRRASEALERNDASEALTSGRRAEREFEEMRDEFRQRAAGQFNDAVRQMRNDAQELDQKQEDLAEQLSEMDKQKPAAGLRTEDNREDIEEAIAGQRERLDDLLERMQDTVEEAEVAEPLLAQKLYDSYRKANQRQVDQQLKQTGELLQRGFDPQAREAEKGASEGIDKLREELESAASSVLGDETRALERALGELEQLERALDEEMRRNNPPGGDQPSQADERSVKKVSNNQDSRVNSQDSRETEPNRSPAVNVPTNNAPTKSRIPLHAAKEDNRPKKGRIRIKPLASSRKNRNKANNLGSNPDNNLVNNLDSNLVNNLDSNPVSSLVSNLVNNLDSNLDSNLVSNLPGDPNKGSHNRGSDKLRTSRVEVRIALPRTVQLPLHSQVRL